MKWLIDLWASIHIPHYSVGRNESVRRDDYRENRTPLQIQCEEAVKEFEKVHYLFENEELKRVVNELQTKLAKQIRFKNWYKNRLYNKKSKSK